MLRTLDRIADARLEACRRWPYAATAILSLIPVSKPDMPHAAAVDARWRLYYNADRLANMGEPELAFVIQHEVSHLLLRHHRRGAKVLKGNCPRRAFLWNAACDIAIHCLLASDGVVIPDGCLTAERYGFADGLSAEEYFGLLMAEEKDQDDPQGSQDSQSPSQDDASPSSGSCSDGQQRPWEDSLEDTPMTPGETEQADGDSAGEGDGDEGLDDTDTDAICQAVAESASNRSGGGSGGLARVADHLIEPAVSIERLLRMAIASTSQKVKSGGGHSSYRRLSRRPAVGGALRARTVTPCPSIAVIIDTSGSMRSDDIALALGMIAKCLRSLSSQDGVRVITGDCYAASDQTAFHPRQVDLVGGGGTDMGELIETVANGKNRPDLILCVTDGVTPWPDRRTAMPVVACLTREFPSRSYPIPSWMKHVCLKR